VYHGDGDDDSQLGGQSKKKRPRRQKGVSNFNKHEWLLAWDKKYGDWVRRDETWVWCAYCKLYPALRSTDAIAKGELRLEKVESRYLARHVDTRGSGTNNNGVKHTNCVMQYNRDHPKSTPTVPTATGMRRYVQLLQRMAVELKFIVCNADTSV
jgi:hypothetical protein